MATRKAEVSVTCNIRQPRQAQKILVTALENLRKEYERLVAAGKQNDAETQKMKKDMDALASAVDTNKQNMNRIKKVMDNLSGSTLKQLNAALREVKRQMSGKSSNSADLAKLQSQYSAITDQIKKHKGELVEVSRNMSTLPKQSDAWLSKAISKQKELVAETQRGTREYHAQKSILKQLMAEQSRRSNMAIQTKGSAAMALARNPTGASMVDLRTARQDLLAYRDNLGKGGISLGPGQRYSTAIKQINDLLKAIDAQIDSINGKEQKVALTAQQIVQSVKQIDFSKASPAQLKAKLDEVNHALANMGKNDPMRTQLMQSAKQLQSALDSLEGRVVNVKGVLANLDKASPRKLQAALDQVNKSLNNLGQNDARRKKLLKDAEQLRAALNRVKNGTVDVNKVLANLKSASLNDLKKAASQLEQEISKLNRTTDARKFSDKRNQLRQLNQEIQRVNGSVTKQESAWKKTLSAITAYMGVTMIIGKVQQMLTSVMRLNLKFSDQLADIRKVSGLAMDDINTLATRLATIDTRTTIEELNRIAYAGAKLGIGKYGVEGLEGFTRAANQVNVALKEDLGEDALTALSKITEVMGLIPKMGVEKSMLATGSAMFQLSATSTATAGNIVEFSKRLTGLAKVTGITTDQLLGLASASDAMFLMPEVSATAFNKLFTSIQTKHNLIENELAIEPGTINNLYSAGRAMDAIVLIFEKMREKGNMNALQGIFKDLGSDGARLVNVMVTMSQNVDMLKDHLEIAQDAFEKATAVTNEYNIQQETAQAYMERASNVWEKAFINPDGVDSVKSMAKAWYDVSVSITQSTLAMVGMKTILWLIITAVKLIIALLPTLITFMLFKGVVASLMGIRAAYLAIASALKATTIQQLALNAAQKANVWIALASIIVSVTLALYDYCKAANKAAESQKRINSFLEEAESEYQKQKYALKSYLAVLEDVNTSTQQRERILRKFNKEFQPYLDKLGIEIRSVEDLKRHYAALNDEIRKKMYYQMRDKAYTELLETDKDEDTPSLLKSVSNALMNYSRMTSNTPWLSAFDTKWLEEQVDAGRDAHSIAMGAFQSLYPGLQQSNGYYGEPTYTYINETGQRVDLPAAMGPMPIEPYIQKYIDARKAYDARKAEIDKAFDPILQDYNPASDVDLGNLDREAPDKDAIKEARDADSKKKKKYRDERKDLQDEVLGIIDNLKNFYGRQHNAVTDKANDEQWDQALLDNTLEIIDEHKEKALAEARKAIYGIPNQWDEIKAQLGKDMVETDKVVGTTPDGREVTYNMSRDLIEMLRRANPDAIRNRLGFLDKQLNLSDGSSLAEVLNKATESEGKVSDAEQRRQREYLKYILENNFQRKVDSEYTESMTRLGYFDIDLQQSNTLFNGSRLDASAEEKEAAQKVIKDRLDAINAVLKSSVKNYVDLLSVGDVTTEKGRNAFLSLLFGPDYDESAIVLRGIVESTGEELEVFYDQILKYVDDYTEATKKAEDRAKKLADFQWSHSPEKASLDAAQANNDRYSKGLLQHAKPEEAAKRPDFGVYGNSRFAPEFGVDPEVEAYRLKLEVAKAYYEYLKAHGMEEDQLHEQQMAIAEAQAAYVEKLSSRIKSQMDELLQMHEPIEDFGTKVGEAFATMTEDAEAGRKALKAAIGDMINSFMKQTVEMTKEYVKRAIMQKAHDRLMQTQIKKETKAETSLESEKQDQLLDVQELGGKAKEMLTAEVGEKVQDASQKIGQEALQTQQVQTQQEVQTESAKTQANTTMGIASGASKIIGSLGWWGIPLVAVITALLNGLLSFAMSKVSSLFGGGSSDSDTTVQTKLVSGMLTYDSGNVQAFRGVEDGKTYPVVGSDGKVYAAKDGGELSTGLVEDPITTLVNGQPALVAERGPEMVIGRETTAAMMMARPDILAEIVKFDRQRSGRTYRAYDSGNVGELPFSLPDGSAYGSEEMAQLRSTINSLTLVLAALQKDGISAHINKYGRGGVADAARSGSKFMQRNSGDALWRD